MGFFRISDLDSRCPTHESASKRHKRREPRKGTAERRSVAEPIIRRGHLALVWINPRPRANRRYD